jgi:uncharacterized protein DUF4386
MPRWRCVTDTMDSNDKIARTAGLLYLVVIATGIFSLAYVPSRITAGGNALATVNNIARAESLFRLGIVSELIQYTVWLLLPFALYRLLHKVNRNAALLMVVLVIVSIPISFANVANKLDVLSLLGGAHSAGTFTIDQLNAQVMLSLAAYHNRILIAEIFWGLWLLPFGYLVFKSGFLPRILGILLMMGCFGYLIDSFGSLLFPGYTTTIIPSFIMLPASFGEIGTCLWLLVVGAGTPRGVRSTVS